MCDSSSDVIRPLILGCETKQSKIIQICLASVQKVIEAKILNVNSASMLVNTLWLLTDNNLEELKILQTIILLVTTTDIVKHNLLAKTLTIALRLLASKDQTVMNTATAMLSQMVTKVFDRVLTENKQNDSESKQIDMDQLKLLSKEPPNWMNESAQDAYMFLQDLYLLLNSDQSLWLHNINDISKPFGLELLKSILVRYPDIFKKNPEMCFILKERICPLLIKLFSPSTKLKINSTSGSIQSNLSTAANQSNDQKSVAYFSIVSRLIRIVFVLIQLYFELLITESEIFLSLLTKFLDVDRPLWQKALAIEVFHKISVETNLIRMLIVNYDMKQHPEKIFSLITSGIALFIQSLFLNAATNTTTQTGSQSSSSTSSMSSNQNSTQNSAQTNSNAFAFQISSAQPSFIYKEITIQLLFPYVSGQVKATYLDTWDKSDVPYIQDGYLLSIGFATLQELTKSVQILIEQNLNQYQKQSTDKPTSLKRVNPSDETISAPIIECIQIMNSCSNSFLFVYNILLESSLDETITDQIIKSIKIFIYLSSLLNMNAQRDAFVTSLCKAALPANYAHNVLNLKTITDLNYLVVQAHNAVTLTPIYSNKPSVNKTLSYDDSSYERQIQVVATGPPLHLTNQTSSSSSSSSLAGNLSITAKNLLIMKSILNMSHLYAELIGSSWYIILNTMQHITWTLSLKPSPGSNGQLKNLSGNLITSPTTTNSTNTITSTTNTDQSNSMITTAIQTEIAFICNMLSKLFDSTRQLSDQALNDIIDALMQLSIECSDLAYLRNEPCLFAVAKLFETSIANLNRIDLFWQKVTVHLLCACKHTNIKYREWCVDSICNMIRCTFNYKYSNSSVVKPVEKLTDQENRILRDSILHPLFELSSIGFNDVRQKQIECTLSILRLMGQYLNESWPLCLNIIGAIQKEHSESLIRSAFQCLQLVVTDFLSMIKANYLSLVINVVSKFGSQEQDLNISLTAIVLLWNISDYMFQNSEQLNEEIKKLSEEEQIESIESVWMVLYSRLGQLCVDPRPAVRKSAGQTLFCTISSHGSVLSVDSHWKDLIWNVLFPLLEQVRHFTSTASREKDKHANQPNFLMHHSRDTAEKQWAETSVLTLAGVTRVFNSKCFILVKLENGEFHKMWLFLLNIIESLALSRNSEIALSALRGFHELLGNQNYFCSASSFAGASNSAAQTVAAAASAASVVNTQTVANPVKDTTQRKKLDNESASLNVNSVKSLDINEWLSSWSTWLNIGNSLISNGSSQDSLHAVNWPPPTQTYLTCYVELVSVIVEKLAPVSKFSLNGFESFSKIIDKLLAIPVLNSDYSSFILMQVDTNLTPLQNASLNTIKHFIKLFKTTDASFQKIFISLVFHRLLSFVLYACYNSNPLQPNMTIITTNNTNGLNGTNNYTMIKQNEVVAINFVQFGEKALLMVTNLYDDSASHEAVIEKLILKSIIQVKLMSFHNKFFV